ncbi:hypothetical protein ACP70R_015427 [Stipagrostis hirtigluma subsp. patula]
MAGALLSLACAVLTAHPKALDHDISAASSVMSHSAYLATAMPAS